MMIVLSCRLGMSRFLATPGFLGMSVEMLDRVYGHHHPDYLRSAASLIGYRRRETVPVSVPVPVTLPTPGPGTQAIAIISGPGRTRTSNQTVMSGRKPRTLSKNRAFSMIFVHRRECSDGCFWGETGAVTEPPREDDEIAVPGSSSALKGGCRWLRSDVRGARPEAGVPRPIPWFAW
jgi:hypothetical protein